MFDPNLPLDNTTATAVQMRAQFNGLHDLIDALNVILAAQVDAVNTINHNEPATATANLVGNTLHFSFDIPRGGVGAPGPPFAQALVDAVNTLDPGQAATVTVDFDGTHVRFTFGIPRGNDGTNGVDGTNGSDGAVGPPFTNFLVDGVTTLNANDPATVEANFDGNAVHLLFGIPRGNDGTNGVDGTNGNDGTNGADGSNGNDGAVGPPFTNFVVDSVTTLDANEPATVEANFDGNAVRLLFGIPRGNDGTNGVDGTNGNDGTNGADGSNGSDGAVGPPFTNFVVDGVTTLDANEPATVEANFDGNAVRLLFGIPRGLDGQNGMNGNDGGQGIQGEQGIQGPPGEVTNADLGNAISGTSSNTNGVMTLDTPFADPDAETLRQAYNTLVLAARR